MATSSRQSIVLIPAVAALALVGLWMSTLSDELVVYCAHDAVYAQEILDEFTRQTGIRVRTRFDTEATKSLGLINLISQERQQPRCDLFWNNELLGMMELHHEGLLEPYQGSGWHRIPERYRDSEGYWVGFAARMRVMVFHQQLTSADNIAFQNLLSNEPSHVAIAKPLFGTTLTHYAAMWHLWGDERVKAWHNDLCKRGLRVVDGNAAVKDAVAIGTCFAGLTDTDDYFVAVDEKQSITMQPVRLTAATSDLSKERDTSNAGLTICIPNTAGIIRGTRRREAAQRLIDFLASPQTELALARSKSRQIPLGAVDESKVPEEVRKLAEWSRDSIDLRSLRTARIECLKWLQTEYLN